MFGKYDRHIEEQKKEKEREDKNMKKKIIGLGIGIALAAAALGVTGYAAASGTESLFSNVIGEERAEEIVLDDAGVTRQEALMGTTTLEYDNGQYVYDIEFTSEGLKYDYDILASDGSIVESSHEPVSKEDLEEDTLEAAAREVSVTDKAETNGAAAPDAVQSGQEAAQQTTSQKTSGDASLISVEKAKEIALADAGYEESQVIMEKARYDRADEDDPAEYEIEFIADGMEYEYSIDPVTGAIREKDKERDDD